MKFNLCESFFIRNFVNQNLIAFGPKRVLKIKHLKQQQNDLLNWPKNIVHVAYKLNNTQIDKACSNFVEASSNRQRQQQPMTNLFKLPMKQEKTFIFISDILRYFCSHLTFSKCAYQFVRTNSWKTFTFKGSRLTINGSPQLERYQNMF